LRRDASAGAKPDDTAKTSSTFSFTDKSKTNDSPPDHNNYFNANSWGTAVQYLDELEVVGPARWGT
jgi:hypothetical protein